MDMEFRPQFHDHHEAVRFLLRQLVQLVFLQVLLQKLWLLDHIQNMSVFSACWVKPPKPSSTSCELRDLFNLINSGSQLEVLQIFQQSVSRRQWLP